MFTENGITIDMDELHKVVEQCDVFTVGFRLFPQRVIVDSRSSHDEGPMIEVVDPVATVEERFFWLGKRRPSFGVPDRFTFFIWPHSITYLEESGVVEEVRRRIEQGGAQVRRQIARVMYQLRVLEHQAEQDAVSGSNYHTLWERASGDS